MSTTTIKRKALRNRIKAKTRKEAIKRLAAKPTLKNIDIEAVKASFGKSKSTESSKKVEEVNNEELVEKREEKTEPKAHTVKKKSTSKEVDNPVDKSESRKDTHVSEKKKVQEDK
jgi:hypothetical protein